jgi:anthranilate synthase component 1
VTIPDYETFRELARHHPIVPVYRELIADEETPVSAFRKLGGSGDAALLESVGGGETWGRFSTIALDPSLVFESRGDEVILTSASGREVRKAANPMTVLDDLVRAHRSAEVPGVPRMAGGAIGFVSYDLVRRLERIESRATDDLELPDARFAFFETGVLFDHRYHTLQVVVNARPGDDPRAAYDRAVARIDAIAARLSGPESNRHRSDQDTARHRSDQDAAHPRSDQDDQRDRHPSSERGDRASSRAPAESSPQRSQPDAVGTPRGEGRPKFRSSVTKERFCNSVERAQEYIRAGHVVQVVLAQRFEAELAADPFDVYRALRVINPSPYMFFLQSEGLAIAGASPEVLVRRQGARVEVRPIAGTRPRGESAEEDERHEADLLASEKEQAEHIMLVDLGRNDVGRVARFGSVAVTELMTVERYSHVMHLVSHVVGEVPDATSNAEVLAACFPAGTVSGAPKIRAMEIIEELEPLRRGIYAGAVGYLDFHGNMDTCIAIRTLVIRNGRAYLGAGAGIVADSEPEEEYAETVNKASALMRACELAEQGLDGFSRARFAQRMHGPGGAGEPA